MGSLGRREESKSLYTCIVNTECKHVSNPKYHLFNQTNTRRRFRYLLFTELWIFHNTDIFAHLNVLDYLEAIKIQFMEGQN